MKVIIEKMKKVGEMDGFVTRGDTVHYKKLDVCKRVPVEAHIKVFITRDTKRFRAYVCEKHPTIMNPENCVKHEITVGGQEWDKGKLKEYHSAILDMCDKLMIELDDKLDTYQPEKFKSWVFQNEVDFTLLETTVRSLMERGAPLTSVISTLTDLGDYARDLYSKSLMKHEKEKAQDKALEETLDKLKEAAKTCYGNIKAGEKKTVEYDHAEVEKRIMYLANKEDAIVGRIVLK